MQILKNKKKIFILMSSFIHRIQAKYSLLRKSEKKIADYLQQNSNQRLDISITEFAKLLKVSETTISRFCRVVGYQGFQDLKLSMAASLSNDDEFMNIPSDIHETDSTSEICVKLSDSLSNAVAKTQQSLNIGDIDVAIDAVVKAKQIVLYGVGGSSIIVYAAHHLFTKAGLNCVAYTDGYMQIVTASMLNAESVVIGVSNTGVSKHVLDAMNVASIKGATTIGITSDRESLLAQAVKVCLVTPLEMKDIPLYGGAIEAKVCQLYLLDLLYLGVLFKVGSPLKQNLKETASVLRTYYNPI
jgi:RpiR family transcriptional regulator, carbohydrate utilization regulator